MTLLHPCYFPNTLVFSLLLKDQVIWEVHDNFQKQTYRNRAYIATDRGRHLLSVPMVHAGHKNGRQLYGQVVMDHSNRWQRQHWRTLETAYRTSPFFEFYEDDLRPLFQNETDQLLLDFNLKCIGTVCNCLQIPFPTKSTSGYETDPKGVLDMRHLVNAKKEPKTEAPHYVQVFGDRHGFIPHLSILDLMFNMGPNAVSYLMDLPRPMP